MALMRAVHSALTPHITRAAASKSDVFPTFGFGTKVAFGVVSIAAWGAMLLREWLTHMLLGSEYGTYQDVFAAVVLAQCFVLLGHASALLLNSVGDFRLQKTYYVFAAAVMLLLAFPVAYFTGVFGVAVVYLIVRTVDVWLLHAALRTVGRKILTSKVLAAATAWCGASLAAWLNEPVGCFTCGTIFVVMLWRWKLTHSFAQRSDCLAVAQ
jgi:O-antigen/teichoic acid export membrane protein